MSRCPSVDSGSNRRILITLITLISLVPLPSASEEVDYFKQDRFFQTLKFGHYYGLTSQTHCPSGSNTYVVGARARLSDHLNQTSKVVSAVEVLCSDGIRTRVFGDPTFTLDKNVGTWTDVRECPNGQFATDMIFNMDFLQIGGLIAYTREDEFYNSDRNSPIHLTAGLDIHSIVKDKFVVGLTFNCSYRGNKRKLIQTFDDIDDPEEVDKGSSFTLGESTGYGIRIYCLRDRVITGLYTKKQGLVSGYDGERMIPIKVTIKCEEIFNPARNCHPELGWEPVPFDSQYCIDINGGDHINSSLITEADAYPQNISCTVRHSVGSTLNKDITNLEQILAAYKPSGMAENIGVILIPKLLSPHFRSDWENKYKLGLALYEKAIYDQPFDKYLHLHENQISKVDFTNINYNFSEGSTSQGIAEGATVQHELAIFQLVAYCSVYKIYFPLFKNKMQNFVRKDIDGIERDIVVEKLAK